MTHRDRNRRPLSPLLANGVARAAKQHIASGGARLRPVATNTAAVAGNPGFTVRAKKGAFTHSAGRQADSVPVRCNVLRRPDGSGNPLLSHVAPAAGASAASTTLRWPVRRCLTVPIGATII
ncbi:hypothetical protein ABIA33_001369 [Streptacidiphilus sp. MAP12-16]